MKLCGVNIGGLFSQNKDFSDQFIDQFITNEDIKMISEWGFNLIRLSVDYNYLEDGSASFKNNQRKINKIDRIIQWAGNYNIHVILDFHNVPGFTFEWNLLNKNDIWDKNSLNRKMFLDFWEFFSEHYKDYDNIIYELLNEPAAPDNNDWMKLAEETIHVIRINDPHHFIVVESNNWGKTETFTELKKFEDNKIIYSFHFYEPLLITHQLAPWTPFFKFYKMKLSYPGSIIPLDKEVTEEIKNENFYYNDYLKLINSFWDKEALQLLMKPVFDFKKKYDVPVLCGEFGCYVMADPKTRQNWLEDIISIFRENDISYSYWTYKNMDFGIYDFTDLYLDNPNYDPASRLDIDTLKILQSGINIEI